MFSPMQLCWADTIPFSCEDSLLCLYFQLVLDVLEASGTVCQHSASWQIPIPLGDFDGKGKADGSWQICLSQQVEASEKNSDKQIRQLPPCLPYPVHFYTSIVLFDRTQCFASSFTRSARTRMALDQTR